VQTASPDWQCTSGPKMTGPKVTSSVRPEVTPSVWPDGSEKKYVSVTVDCTVSGMLILGAGSGEITRSGNAVRQVHP